MMGASQHLLVVTTRSRLRHVRFFPVMLLASRRIRRQLAQTEGLVWSASIVAGPTEFWTITVWRSLHAMQEFMRSGAHGEIMWLFPRWLDSFWLARWRPGAREVGSWHGLALASPDETGDRPVSPYSYEGSSLVTRERELVADTTSTLVRLPLTPRALLELRRVRRRLTREPDLLRVVAGAASARELYVFAVWRGRARPAALLGEWAETTRRRLGDRVWALECVPEGEFGHWDGLRLRALRPVRPRSRAGQGAAVEPQPGVHPLARAPAPRRPAR